MRCRRAEDAEILLTKGTYAYFTSDFEMARLASDEAQSLVLAGERNWQVLDLVALQGMLAHRSGSWFDRMRLELRRTRETPEIANTIFDGYLCPAEYMLYGQASYAEVIETYLDRVGGDVWTVEMKDRSFADLELFNAYKNRMPKKLAVGIVSHRTLQVESPDEVAADVRYALNYIDPENLILTTDCGFGRQGSNRLVAFYKSAAIVQGANLVRRELGLEEEPVRAADPLLQIDAPAPRRT